MVLKPGRCYIHDLLIEAELTSGTYIGAHKYVLLVLWPIRGRLLLPSEWCLFKSEHP